MRLPDPKHDRRFPIIGGFEFGEHRRIGARVDDFEGQIERSDHALIVIAPADGPAHVAALGCGVGR